MYDRTFARMDRLRAFSASLVLVVALMLLAAMQQARADSPVFARLDVPPPTFKPMQMQVKVTRLTVPVNQSGVLRIEQNYAEVLVGNAEIADVMPLTDRTVYVLGKKIGATRLSVLDSGKQLVGVVEIEVSYDVNGLRAALSENLPEARINVTSLNGSILLTGLVPDSVALQSAVAIANQFAPEAVTNQIIVEAGQQVMLEVRFVEAKRDAGRDLGVNWSAVSKKAGNFAGLTGLGQLTTFPVFSSTSAFPSGREPFGTLLARIIGGGTPVDVLINALEERGIARRLAEPNLVALSGDTANFLAGGEFPFVVGRDEDGTPIVAFKKFGISLGFTPTVLSNGTINLKIKPEVSEIDPTLSTVVNGLAVPGLATRRAETTVELRDGQSFAIAGLLQSHHRKEQRQIPWIGQVPVLGTLFRSASYEKNETDLVIIVTPRLVQPASPEQKLVTPFDKSVPGNDVDFFLGGKAELPTAEVVHPKKTDERFGHIMSISARRNDIGTYK